MSNSKTNSDRPEVFMQSETTSPATSRFLWVDWIRGIGILLVVLGHVSGSVIERWSQVSQWDWNVANIYNVVARACVPLLFMVSGVLLLQPRQEGIWDFYRKRVQRVLLPFVFWSLIYLATRQGCFDFTGSLSAWQDGCNGEHGVFALLRFWTISIVTGPVAYHLWFMYELFAIYMFTPILRVFVSKAREEHLWYFLALWFLAGPVFLLVDALTDVNLNFKPGFLAGYVGYFLLGYMLSRIRITKPMLWASAIVYILAGTFTGWSTYVLSNQAGRLVDVFQYLLGLNIILLSTSLYILLKYWGEALFSQPHPRLEKLAVTLTKASFGIYLIHVLVIEWLKAVRITPIYGSSLVMVPVTTLAVFFVSWIVIGLLMKVPYLRALVT